MARQHAPVWGVDAQACPDDPDMMATFQWQKEIYSAFGVSAFMGSTKTRQFMECEYVSEKAFLTELGLARAAPEQ